MGQADLRERNHGTDVNRFGSDDPHRAQQRAFFGSLRGREGPHPGIADDRGRDRQQVRCDPGHDLQLDQRSHPPAADFHDRDGAQGPGLSHRHRVHALINGAAGSPAALLGGTSMQVRVKIGSVESDGPIDLVLQELESKVQKEIQYLEDNMEGFVFVSLRTQAILTRHRVSGRDENGEYDFTTTSDGWMYEIVYRVSSSHEF